MRELARDMNGSPESAPRGRQSFSVEAEQAVLGGLMLEPAAWSNVAGRISTEDFYRPDHRLIFSAIGELAGDGTPCDVVTVSLQLERAGNLENAGGLAYLSMIARETPTGRNAPAYADIVRELAVRRNLSDLLEESADRAEFTERVECELARLKSSERPDRRITPLDWPTLDGQTPPERDWAIEHWLGMGHVTLLAGSGSMGKSLVAQTLGSCLALRREYLDWAPKPRRVLGWFCEDDTAELWRRQVAIARWLDVSLSEFADRFTAYSYDGQVIELARLVDQRLEPAPMMKQLREQIGDLKADVVLLDNVARLYAGNENDRHQVTSFISMLTAAAAPTRAAVLLLGHPGKAKGSEFSGSTAWEGAVRTRLYLGNSLPDQDKADDEDAADDGVRYLSRRKANYSARDWRRLQFRDGILIPDAPIAETRGSRPGPEYARDVVTRAVRKLAGMDQYGVAGRNSPNHLPRLASEYKLLENVSERDFATAMRSMQADGALLTTVVGTYSNRTPKKALVLPGFRLNGAQESAQESAQ
jgi:hypothetical protein